VPGQTTVQALQPIRLRQVEANGGAYPFDERHEAARHQRRARTPRTHGPYQRSGAWHEPHTFAEDLVEHMHRQPFEQGDPGAQRGHEVDLAVQRTSGDRAHLELHPEIVRQLVDALDRDHRRVHVAHEQALAAALSGQDDEVVRQLGRQCGLDAGSDLGSVTIFDRQLAGFVRREPARRRAERPLHAGDRRAIERHALGIRDQTYDMGHGADCPRSPAAMQATVP
jgi:hypothetical protein